MDEVDVYSEMGRFFIEQKDYDMAINVLNKAIELGPNYPLPYDERGIAALLDFDKQSVWA